MKSKLIIIAALAALTATDIAAIASEFSGTSSSGPTSSGPTSSGAKQDPNRVVLVDFDSLERASRERLGNLIANGSRSGDVAAASESLHQITAARYLSVTSRLTEHVANFADGFRPQLAAAPDLLKKALPMIMRSDDMPQIATQVVQTFLEAKTANDARVAMGDILRLIPALEARDRAKFASPSPFGGKTAEETKKLEDARTAAGNAAFEAAWKASKATESVKGETAPQSAAIPK